MNRRTILKSAGATMIASQIPQAATAAPESKAAWNEAGLERAAAVMTEWTQDGRVLGASILVQQGARQFARNYGAAQGTEPVFLLASITKPMTAVAVMTLVDAGALSLDDTVAKFFPQFIGDGRQSITLRHCLTHSSGLPDMLSNDEVLRERAAPLADYRDGAFIAPLKFAPGSSYSYSSMGILLAAEIAQKITGTPFARLMDDRVFGPLGMGKTSFGLGGRDKSATVPSQAIPASTPAGRKSWQGWNWNSDYWRNLAAPWGGALGPAIDIVRFYDEFLLKRGRILKPATEAAMTVNQAPPGVRAYGLGFDLHPAIGSPANGPGTFGHNGATGTLSWCDPVTGTICVVLTTLYEAAVKPHPTRLVSDLIAQATGKTL